MYLPLPDFDEKASASDIKRYLVKLTEAIETKLRKMEENNNGD